MNKTTTKLIREERETHLSISDDQKYWIADTSISRDIRKFEKQGWDKLNETLYSDGTIQSATFSAPRRAISIRNAAPNTRVITDEHKQKLMAARNKKVNAI